MISPSFTVSQSAITPKWFTVTDTSTGTYDTITYRRLYVSDSDGQYLTGDGTVNYDVWPLADLSLTLTFLTEDIGANIRIDWMDASNLVVDTLNNNYPLSEIGKQFLYALIQAQGLVPGIYMDTNYAINVQNYWMNILAGDHAVNYGNDIAAAQNCYSRETLMRLEQAKYF